jgi:holo-[acyl-carrier protein] synthase
LNLDVLLRTGVDLIEVSRVAETLARHGDRFLRRCFTAQELTDCAGQAPALAARFAAKEAVAKALGCGIGDVQWLDIEIRRGARGQPELLLHGAAQTLATELGLTEWSLSLSHTQEHSVALVVAVSGK